MVYVNDVILTRSHWIICNISLRPCVPISLLRTWKTCITFSTSTVLVYPLAWLCLNRNTLMIFFGRPICTIANQWLARRAFYFWLQSHEDPTLYRTTVGSLQYFLVTILDLVFFVNWVYQFMHAPRISHWQAIKAYFTLSTTRPSLQQNDTCDKNILVLIKDNFIDRKLLAANKNFFY